MRGADERFHVRTERLRNRQPPKHRPGYERPNPAQARIVRSRPKQLRPVGR